MSKFLPEELAIEILVRLSTKDLARFRCVCRTWRDLSDDREFAKRCRDISPATFVSFYDKGFYLLDVIEVEVKNPVIIYKSLALCVTLKNHTLMVWNPSSKQFKILPNPDIYHDSNILGFGYDPVYDDYKVVTFIDRLDSSTAQVFDFKTDSWRESVRIPTPDWHYRERRGIFLDQCLYWIAYRSDVDRFVLCFNLSTHEYRKVPLPVYNQGVTSSWLGITNQKLCITEYETCKISISVLEITGSWNKIISLSMSNLIIVQDRILDYQVDFVSFTKNNDLVLTFTGYDDHFKKEHEERTITKKVFLYKTGAETIEEVRFCNSLVGFQFLGDSCG